VGNHKRLTIVPYRQWLDGLVLIEDFKGLSTAIFIILVV